jgi:hypothetical protein
MWRRDGSVEGHGVADECEAFLAGRYLELLERNEALVPQWAWMNRLAHGTTADLEAIATHDATPRDRLSQAWADARSYLAAEVLDAYGRAGTLLTLQRRALVPLELQLASPTSPPVRRPADWVGMVMAAIARVASSEEGRRRA